MSWFIITHGGVGTSEEFRAGVERGATAARRVLEDENGSALDAAVAAVVVMEDDGSYDAGIGSYYNLDGEIEMDAAVMDEREECGAVAAIKNVKNPILVARSVMDTPHVLLVGTGAFEFARASGFKEFQPGTDKTKKRLEEVKKRLKENAVPDWASRWKEYRRPGTVGAVVFDGRSGFGATNSTGGTSYQLPGRVGDSAVIGSGLFASKLGAVVTTGIGEDIIRKVLAKSIYDKITGGMTPQEACDWGVALYPTKIPMGAVAVTADGYGSAANDVMPVEILRGTIEDK